MIKPYKPIYQWRPTWPDVDNDFSACDGDRQIARIYKDHAGKWRWFLQIIPGQSGYEETAREAVRQVEQAYGRTK